jgi:hypothetical protein
MSAGRRVASKTHSENNYPASQRLFTYRRPRSKVVADEFSIRPGHNTSLSMAKVKTAVALLQGL